jgi:hypothetical protein
MPYSCQFCGEIEESDVLLRCNACGGEKIVRGTLGNNCADCTDAGAFTAVCPTCGSEELEV